MCLYLLVLRHTQAGASPTGLPQLIEMIRIFQLFELLVQQGKTIVMVTHDQSLAERFSRVLRIADGEIVDEKVY